MNVELRMVNRMYRKKVNLKSFLTILLLAIIGTGCEEHVSSPKPRSYLRIDLPGKKYNTYEGDCPFTFEYPEYSTVVPDKGANAEPCWMNIEYAKFHASLNISYKKIEGNVRGYMEDSRTLASKHMVKATGIEEQPILLDSSHVYGLLYNIEGNTASAIQFYVTDSTRHFIRGALYFNAPPNADSIAPVLNFLKEDIHRMIQTFRWKN